MPDSVGWEERRDALLGRRISELGLSIGGTRIERLVDALYAELASRGLKFRPPVYLSDQWGCPDGTPLIGIPFYLADPDLERIEAEMSLSLESDADAMRFLRHEAGHAFNYAFRFHERPDWRQLFGAFTRPYRERYRADPFSRDHVRHILAWYAQKHPDEDFAETFAVWLTPDIDWRREYAGWPALAKLDYVDRLLRETADLAPPSLTPAEDDLPVEAMRYSVSEHYVDVQGAVPVVDERQFDVDLRQIFACTADAPQADSAGAFLTLHYREIVGRISFWSSEQPSVVRSLLDALRRRAMALDLRVGRLEAATLIELTAFATAVVMLYREQHVIRRARAPRARTGAGL